MVVLEEGAAAAALPAPAALPVPAALDLVLHQVVRPPPRYPLSWSVSFYPIWLVLWVAVFGSITYGIFQGNRTAGTVAGIFLGVVCLFVSPFFAVCGNYRNEYRIWSIIPFLVLASGAYIAMMLLAYWCPIMDRDAAVIHSAVYNPPMANLSQLVVTNPSGLWVIEPELPDRAVFSIPSQSPNFIGFAINDSSTVFVLQLALDDIPYPGIPFPVQSDGRLWLVSAPNAWRPSLYWIQTDLQTRFPGRNFTSFLIATNPLSNYHHSRSVCVPSVQIFAVLGGLAYGYMFCLQLAILFFNIPCR